MQQTSDMATSSGAFPRLGATGKTLATGRPSAKPQKPLPPPPPTWAVVARDKNGKMSSEDIKAKLMKDVATQLKTVKVTAVRRTREGVTIETATSGDMAAIKASGVFGEQGLALSPPPPPMVKVLIRGVPSHIEDGDLIEELVTRNADPSVPLEQFARQMRLIGCGAKDAPEGNVTLEVAPTVSAFWKASGGVDIFWRFHRIRELSGVELCFKCFGHRHTAKACEEKEPLCLRCGEAGHLIRTCPNAESCRNCRIAGKHDGHAVNSNICPIYGRALERCKNRPRYQE